MANLFRTDRDNNKIELGTTGTTINVASHTASSILGLDASKDLESLARPLIVANGGTGLATITDGGLLLGSGTGAITPLAQATNGQLPIGSTGVDCVLAALTGTVNQITVTNGAGSITLATPQDIHTGAIPQFLGLGIGAAGSADSILIQTADTDDPTLILKTTNTAHQINIYANEDSVNDELFIEGQTASLNTTVNIKAKDGENAVLYLISGNNFSYFNYDANDNLSVANNTQDKDIILQINDGGVTKTITWNADVDQLVHSAGTFNFNSVVTVGDGGITNYTKIEADGTIEFNGAATVYNDLVLPLDSAKVPASNAPDWESFVGNLNAFAYQVNDFQEFTTELIHGYKEGSDFSFHIHGALNALTTQEEKVRFEIEYSIADANQLTGFGDVFPDGSGSLLIAELVVPNATADLTNIFITVGVDNAGTFGIDATIKGRIRRIAKSAGGNELTGNIFVTQVGVHYENDTVGSRTVNAK